MKETQMYGYCRVSTQEQNEDRQLHAMKEFGVPESGIMVEKMSGKDFNRPEYKKLLRKMKSGDTLVIKSIDRLGRDYEEIIEQWRLITKKKKAEIVVIDMPLLDTRKKERDLTGAFVSDLVLQILSYVAEQERVLINQRIAEGIAAAKLKGVRFGRPQKEIPDDFLKIVAQLQQNKISLSEALEQSGMAKSTFYRRASEHTKK